MVLVCPVHLQMGRGVRESGAGERVWSPQDPPQGEAVTSGAERCMGQAYAKAPGGHLTENQNNPALPLPLSPLIC